MLDYVLNHWDSILTVGFAVVGVASMVTAMTPNKDDDAIVSKVKAVLDFIALNVGHAKPK